MENQAPKTKKKKKAKRSGVVLRRIFLGFIILILVMATGIGCGFLTASLNTKPDIAEDIRPPASSHIYDIDGKEIAIVHAAENRDPVKINQVPADLQHAFIAVEDNRFYEHSGIDVRGILRALWANVSGRTISEGGSTITQQLAKNAYLTQDRTMKRKMQEVFLALQLERQYTKQEILELYLNQIYFGQGAYGVQAAAKTYFGKNVEDLNLNECAMLAGIPKSPNYYSPFNNLKAAQERKAIVLEQMAKYHYITQATADSTATADVVLAPASKPEGPTSASYFIDYVTQLLVDRYGADAVYKDGLKIYTTIDMDMQRAAEATIDNILPDYGVDGNGIMQPQMALVSIDPHTGYIKAMVGGRGTDQFNRATMAERQPGSAFKPFVFIAALENDFSPSTVIDDSPITIGDWSPQNDSRRFSGKVTMRTVATYSMNVPTVKIAQKLGMDKPIYYAQEMGITTFVLDGPTNDRNLSSALGGLTKGVTPLELTSAYGTFANNGIHVDPIAIIKVLDRNGKIIEQAEPQEHSVVSAESAAALTSMLQDVVNKGTGTRANIGRPAAGKTGTTSDYHDAWFVGYTPDLVTGVWVGDDNNNSLDGMAGGTVPASIWRSFMESAVANMPVRQFEGYYGGGSVSELRDENSTSSRSEGTESESRHSESRSEQHYDAPAPEHERHSSPNPEVSHPSQPEPLQPSQPAQPEPVRPEPAAPAPVDPEPSGGGGAAPTPGAGGGKSRN